MYQAGKAWLDLLQSDGSSGGAFNGKRADLLSEKRASPNRVGLVLKIVEHYLRLIAKFIKVLAKAIIES